MVHIIQDAFLTIFTESASNVKMPKPPAAPKLDPPEDVTPVIGCRVRVTPAGKIQFFADKKSSKLEGATRATVKKNKRKASDRIDDTVKATRATMKKNKRKASDCIDDTVKATRATVRKNKRRASDCIDDTVKATRATVRKNKRRASDCIDDTVKATRATVRKNKRKASDCIDDTVKAPQLKKKRGESDAGKKGKKMSKVDQPTEKSTIKKTIVSKKQKTAKEAAVKEKMPAENVKEIVKQKNGRKTPRSQVVENKTSCRQAQTKAPRKKKMTKK